MPKESFTDAYALLASSGIPSTEGTSMSVIANPEVTTTQAEDVKALPAWQALKAAVIGLQ